MKALFKLLILLVVTALCSCEESHQPESGELVLRLQFDTDNAPLIESETLTVTLVSNEGIVYTYDVPLQEKIAIRVSSGIYNIMASVKYSSDNIMHFFRGQLSEIILQNGESIECDISMTHSQSGQILISEIYFSGCVGASGKTYFDDQYLILHNNSSDTAYLDKLCLGYVYPLRATNRSPFIDYFEDRSVVSNFLWQFPGRGQDFPLAPGDDAVVAPNCVNHIALGNSESVDLSKEGYWACYDANANLIKQSPPATPDKRMLNLLWSYGAATSCVSSILDPAFVLFKIKGDEGVYLNEYATHNPQSPSSTAVFMGVPYSWIYDAVECFDAVNRYKRLTSAVDGGFALQNKGSASGTSVRRKIDVEITAQMGITVYYDTNNSTHDFEMCYPPTLKE